MANEIVQDADAAITALLQLQMEQEARAGLVAPLFYREVSIDGPSMAHKTSKHPTTADAAAVTDGTEFTTNTAINPTSVTITAAGVAIRGVVTDFSAKGSILTLEEAIGNHARALINKMDVDGCSLLDNFATVVGTSGADFTIGNFLTSIYDLEEANEANGIVVVTDPLMVHNLRTEIVASSAPIYSGGEGPLGGFLKAGVASGSYKGSLFGVPIYATSNTVDDATDKLGAMFAPSRALKWAWKWQPTVELRREPGYIGWLMVAHAAYGYGEIHDLAGVTLRCGNT